jgi:hypothetical protein
MIKGNYSTNHYNEFISTKATQEHWWDKLREHIAFYSSKQYFFVTGQGLSNAETSTVLSGQVTHLGHTSTLPESSKRYSHPSSTLNQGDAKSSANMMTQQSSSPKANPKCSNIPVFGSHHM